MAVLAVSEHLDKAASSGAAAAGTVDVLKVLEKVLRHEVQLVRQAQSATVGFVNTTNANLIAGSSFTVSGTVNQGEMDGGRLGPHAFLSMGGGEPTRARTERTFSVNGGGLEQVRHHTGGVIAVALVGALLTHLWRDLLVDERSIQAEEPSVAAF